MREKFNNARSLLSDIYKNTRIHTPIHKITNSTNKCARFTHEWNDLMIRKRIPPPAIAVVLMRLRDFSIF